MTKNLTDKAIDIKGKKYVLVSDRVLYFNETYPNWSIVTQRIMTEEPWIEIFKATVMPDCEKPQRYFTGYSQAKWWDWFINKTSALENAETSAVGRALAMMWIWVIDSIASVDEINKAENAAKSKPTVTTQKYPPKKDENWNPSGWFQKVINYTEWMKQCLDEEDFIKKIKEKYTVDEVTEWQLRKAYKDAVEWDADSVQLPF
jgi:hypothetical protein